MWSLKLLLLSLIFILCFIFPKSAMTIFVGSGLAMVAGYLKYKRRRIAFSEKQKRVVFASCSGKCVYCQKPLVFEHNDAGRVALRKGAWQIEHIVSHAVGGSNELENLASACVECNQTRANTMQKFGKHNVEEWMQKRLGHEICLKFVKTGEQRGGLNARRCVKKVSGFTFNTCFQTHVPNPKF